ncbi:1-deoxy-D-xylulose-5-phosphate reductoisomerase [Campylobacter helveticus]|uniref:1-deoxy-D-xylulose 5-phosphate reductoisomerase n=1 Tax=Campylobacter helveticus TaxID=28898 RepID=A0ABY3L3Z3_9BACT|nr:1-deoxy-D-xylulose-5-phosphate reductoisomerase [Campylobacter helveticus]ARE80802.1 1-deoxy-D-xylulose 5-phosphate reductoisomerase [Campylobacter helveticus]MCR2039465.1 1-deoxy-D-xylulose-5-phosphate reductoisomerase [Campylobacter helveticus]MCR2054489.1 1-deoxy-D-xylulose-5-phosphate reductoisomerase [Campylobacter helveticus]MCR2056109.1 1-deoxy-D-xylulose-5-phosphate reductoisomerase [Campylobacter helveticus]MCR2060027.1 1-deoxy-D-xylulose-5-phosphate reductoisomerase [Campylobacter
MIVFGSTGSIGVNALKLAALKKLRVSALACGGNIKLLNEQIERFKPEFVCIKEQKDRHLVKHKNVFVGQEGLEKILELSDDTLLLNAIVGFAGLKSTLKAHKLHKKIALANKESLVVAGEFLKGANIIPVDSEHSALSALIQARQNIKKLYICASGGAFFKFKIKNLKSVKLSDALKHPNWSMGAKITIDSATMANKLFEIIEAYHLFATKEIDAFIEPKSLLHALCEFQNGATSAYFSKPDMKLAIAEAIFDTHELEILPPLDFVKLSSLKFHKISLKKYPLFALKNIFLEKPSLGVIINAANEVMVERFLKQKCEFLDISKGVLRALEHFEGVTITELEEVFEYDRKVREYL